MFQPKLVILYIPTAFIKVMFFIAFESKTTWISQRLISGYFAINDVHLFTPVCSCTGQHLKVLYKKIK